MNEITFSNYEHFFGGQAHQVSELTTVNVEDEAALSASYYNTMSGDALNQDSQAINIQRPQQQHGSRYHNHQHENIFPLTTQSNGEQERCVPAETLNCNLSNNVSGGSSVFGAIPFVQIHTTDVQPPRTSYGNVFRRSINNNEEIKSEPIKFESSETSKERINATPTPPRSTNTQNDHLGDKRVSVPSRDVQSSSSECLDKYRSGSFPKIFKCSKCPFISLCGTGLNGHLTTCHTVDRPVDNEALREEISCPGCKNMFYTYKSLEVHLQLDHLMNLNDIVKLVEAIKGNFLSAKSHKETEDCLVKAANKPQNDAQRKSRIYLKNVDCLRDPQRKPIEQDTNQIRENFFPRNDLEKSTNTKLNDHGTVSSFVNNINRNDETDNATAKVANPQKQKISIKSVDVLREPALVRRDYELQNFNNFPNTPIDLNAQLGIISNETFSFNHSHNGNVSGSSHSNSDSLLCNNNESLPTTTAGSAEMEEHEKSRPRPKIYVKNVEGASLGFSFMTSSLPQGGASFLGSAHSLPPVAPIFENTLGHIPVTNITEPCLFDTNTSNNYLSHPNDADHLTFGHTQSSNSYMAESSLFTTNTLECALSASHCSNVPLVTESTPPPSSRVDNMVDEPPTLPVKIFNKSGHIPRKANFHEQRGTLHLRTVDELNLMNKNEVENLIAPNLDNPQNNTLNGTLEKILTCETSNCNVVSDNFDDHFKFQDFDAQIVNGWPENYDDLADDIDCIMAADAPNDSFTLASINENGNCQLTQKTSVNNCDIETPQMSLISIRDIEELTGSGQQISGSATTPPTTTVTNIQEENQMPEVENLSTNQSSNIDVVDIYHNDSEHCTNDGDSMCANDNLKREHSNVSSPANQLLASVCSNDKQSTLIADVPPLVPVTTMTDGITPNNQTKLPRFTTQPVIPLPPLVPVSQSVKLNSKTFNSQPSVVVCTTSTSVTANASVTSTAPVEKGRIYVANNLMEDPKRQTSVSCTKKTSRGSSIRGRPFGANRTGITKLRSAGNAAAAGVFLKCHEKGCAFRFKKSETLDYHKQCHKSPQSMWCPECKSIEFNNWNTLHTHLWRSHQIDMELYSCELCSFKTPVYSRLINTHAKIHSEDRNYKCDQCDKAFKNSKQLKNHRRWHRTHTSSTTAITDSTMLHRCVDCGAAFSHHKSLREHLCKEGNSQLCCEVCQRVLTSKSSLKLHMLTHSSTAKRYKCNVCDYTANDHNAFRRHRMVHDNVKMYKCGYCSYKSVQSVAYQKHILQKHPDKADTVIHKCNKCTFATINRTLLTVHQAKHEKPNGQLVSAQTESATKGDVPLEDGKVVGTCKEAVVSKGNTTQELPKTKIKVKSNLC